MPLINNHSNFDENGNLLPHTLLKMSTAEAQNILINSFYPSDRRRELWEKFNRYRCDMALLLNFNAEQWMDGSYVTIKEIPGDIDVVTFINVNDLMLYEHELKRFLTNNGSKEVYGIDGYIVPVFPTNDPNYDRITGYWVDYWTKWFGKDRDSKPKGIVVLELSCG